MPLDYLRVDKLAWKSGQNFCRIHKNSAQNLQVTRTEFLIFFGKEFWEC